jgi:hypothetical protein
MNNKKVKDLTDCRGFLAALGVALQRVRAAEGSEDSLSLRSSTAEVSEASLRPRSSVAERAESVLLALSTASRRRAPFFMVRLVPVHVRFVSFSVEVLFLPAARFRRFEERGRAVPSAVAFGAALSVEISLSAAAVAAKIDKLANR